MGRRGTPDGDRLAVVEPRYSTVMPWVLVVLGVALAVYTALASTETHVRSRVTAVAPRAAPKPDDDRRRDKHDSRDTGCTPTCRARHVTTTESTPSDATLAILFASAAVLALAGAFYSRVTKLNLGGGFGLELGAAAVDMQKLSELVAEIAAEQRDDPADAARLGAIAAAQANQKVLALRVLGATPAGRPLTQDEFARVRRGAPLADRTLKDIARAAVREAELGDDEPNA
jgi:hypothetical protein